MKKFFYTTGGVAVLIIGIFCLNFIGSQMYGRLDVTEGQLFTLSDGSLKLIDKLDDKIKVKFYFTRSQKNLPVVVKTFASRVEELLTEYSTRSGGKIELEVIDPKPDTDEEEWAKKFGVQNMNLGNGQAFMLGLVMLKGSLEHAVPYLDPRREEFLEYDLSEALYRIMNPDKKTIGIMSSLEINGAPANPMMGGQDSSWAFVRELKKAYNVKNIDISKPNLEGIDLLLSVHAKNLSEAAEYAIDQFIMEGGKAIIAVDPMSRTDLASSPANPMMGHNMPSPSSDMPKLFKAWGIEYDASKMLGDKMAATNIMAGQTQVSYPMFLTLSEDYFSGESIITQSLNQIMLGEPGGFKVTEQEGVDSLVLMHTSEKAGYVGTQMVSFMGPDQLSKDLKEEGKQTLAAMLSGKFQSAFDAKPPPTGDTQEENIDSSKPHIKTSSANSAVIVIADIDFLADSNAVDQMRFGNQIIIRPRNDNINFMFNAVELLSGSDDLISIRSKGKIARPFTTVEKIQLQAQEKWQGVEEELTAKLNDLQAKINEMQKSRTDGSRFALSPEQQTEIANFREEERKISKKRREVRKNLREDIEKLGYKLVMLNMIVVPGVVALFGMLMLRRRSRKKED